MAQIPIRTPIAKNDLITPIWHRYFQSLGASGSCSDLTARVTQNEVNIASNVTNIASNTASININVTNIASNTVNIASNTTAINTNISNITTNTTNIATNVTNIAANSYLINTYKYHNSLLDLDGGDPLIGYYHANQPINTGNEPYWRAVGIFSTAVDPILRVGVNSVGDYGYLKWNRGDDYMVLGTPDGGETLAITEKKFTKFNNRSWGIGYKGWSTHYATGLNAIT